MEDEDNYEENFDEDNYEDVEEINAEEILPTSDAPLKPLTPEEDFEDNTQVYNQNLDVNMPEKKSATILPKEVMQDFKEINKKGKGRKGKKRND